MQRLSIPSLILCCWSAVGFFSDGLSVPRAHSANTRRLSSFLTSTTTTTTTTTTELSSSVSEYFSIETSNKGPAGSPVHTLTIHKLPGQDNKVPPKAKEAESDELEDDAEGSDHKVAQLHTAMQVTRLNNDSLAVALNAILLFRVAQDLNYFSWHLNNNWPIRWLLAERCHVESHDSRDAPKF